MSLPIIWLARADANLQEIFNRLDDRREGAGEDFLKKVEVYLSTIRRFPEIAPFFLRRVRRQVMTGTNFGIFYVVEPTRIVIVNVLDLRQDSSQIRRHLLNGDGGED